MKKTKMNLLMFDGIPEEAYRYLGNYGFHFNKKACEFAVSMMSKRDAGTGKSVPLEMVSKDDVEAMLTKHNVKLENDCMYDATYVESYIQSFSNFTLCFVSIASTSSLLTISNGTDLPVLPSRFDIIDTANSQAFLFKCKP